MITNVTQANDKVVALYSTYYFEHIRRVEPASRRKAFLGILLQIATKLYGPDTGMSLGYNSPQKLGHKLRRQLLAVPILEELHTWLIENQQYTLPQSPIGKTFFYVLSRWKRFLVYTTDGRLEIDNNWLEPACHERRAEQAGI